ncbi:bifunctional DNA-formamidopyrimidine glycosylase/DNA-(apurinic or apyrimidinic site) lyase [Candidatus Saccharibacteria bacterium]|jgi:formamidopyrimidine-DNA glycosylase|nr:bifunctional DNA-formamidopyrimidine glycosylase/DNA-(apurinic or apyrimidinic site) lyase [Candidatus Saccharibacteria bacterium]MBP9131806.1 bifunctional DNA-formamidopyrimidine glycosylase/DNA-(apurinic or apyrimidinic site) lyase [Candidatus Saccharibacteria bacterium]
MPELPEVETVKRGLNKLIINQQIANESHNWPKSFPNSDIDVDKFMIGAKVTDVRRRAKVLMIDLDSDYSLVIHLKMTGQMVFVGEQRFAAGHPNDSFINELPDRSTRVEITFTSGDKLFFNDQRKFGWMRLLPTIEIPNIDFFKKIGPEPLTDEFTSKEFILRVRRRANTSVKAAILDQTVLAGVGNIYADESLFAARIHPDRKVKDVTDAELKKLLEEIKFVMNLSIEKGGSSDRNYVNAEGGRGSYLSLAKVFRKEGQPCDNCGTVIEKTRVAARGTHICPSCQKI